MGASDRFFPLKGINLDIADAYMTNDMARFLKNVVYSPLDTSQVGGAKGASTGMFKTIESVQVYDSSFSLPEGYNHYAGGFSCDELNIALFFNYNSNNNHALYLIDGSQRVIKTVYLKSCLNLQLAPEYFIHEAGAVLEIFNYIDPDTNEPKQRSYFMWVDGFNDFRLLCIEDSIATNGFSATDFPYFVTDYDPCLLINAGVPTSLDAINTTEIPNNDPTKPNQLKFNTWQFRILQIDVYGRPSEHGIISEEYIPGINDCISSSDLLARCLNLKFKVNNPLIDKIQIEFRNCNDAQWYLDTTLFLYNGSNLGEWWKRERNPSVNFNPTTSEITYQFCKDKECNPIDQAETNRTQNPLPKKPQTVAKIGKDIGLGNNRDGFSPMDKKELDKISVEIDPPSATGSNVANIEIFVQIYNVLKLTAQPIWVLDKKGVFGGLTNLQLSIPTLQQNTPIIEYYEPNLIIGYGQNFTNENQRGFIGYLAGTGEPPISAISEQYYLDASNNLVKLDTYDQFDFTRRYFQKFTFNSVTKGKYVFRIAAHQAELSEKTFQRTSTYVAGSFPWNPTAKTVDHSTYFDKAKEIVIDVCNTNYSSLNDNKILVIWDLTSPGLTNSSSVVAGYISETSNNGIQELPVELLGMAINKGSGHIINTTSQFTDHNGFYFATDTVNNYYYHFYGYCGCNNYIELAEGQIGNNPQVYRRDIVLDQQTQKCPSYNNTICNRVLIKGSVFLCGSNIPVPGIGVVYGRGGYAITGADGTFTIVAHDNNYQLGQPRVDNIYFINTICPYVDCDGNCLPNIQVVITPCQVCDERISVINPLGVKFEVKRGLLSAGNYGVGYNMYDWLGRHSFVQTKDQMYFTTPSVVQTHAFAPSTVRLIIPPDVVFPEGIVKIVPCITRELSLDDFIEWIVDRVVFIDNSGNENNAAPTQIKIYYGSLNEYNIQNNFNTTTHWQFIEQQTPQINFTSDYVEFALNGDGSFFPILTRALIKYDQQGQYFLIDYDTSLKDLKQYAKIRLNRPASCQTRNVFYELNQPITIVNRHTTQNNIVLNAFDTYYKYRQIPIPVEIDPDTTQNIIRTFGFPFEHNSPSDFWGQGCANLGKINVRNPYEAEILKPNEIALSGSLSPNGQLNYLNYFDDAQKRNFDTWDFGGITAIISQAGLILVICQNDAFTVGFNDNILRTDESGQVQVPSADQKFGNPQTKVGNNYGCLPFDKNTIRSREGLVQYLNSQKAYIIQHDYNNPVPVSAGIIDSWLRPKIKYIQEWNKTHENKKYFTGGIDPAANSYLLSDFTIGSTSFVNKERGYNIETQETVSFDFYSKAIRVWFGFSPQGYIYLDTNLLEKQLFSFAKDNVYFHYSTDKIKSYGTIYGEVVNDVIRFVAVMDNVVKKQPLNVSNYCVQKKYFSDQILTEGSQKSRIMLTYFKFGNDFSAAPILCNETTLFDPNLKEQTEVNKILDGDKLIGSVIDIRLIGDPAKATQYSEYLGSTVEVFAQQKSGT